MANNVTKFKIIKMYGRTITPKVKPIENIQQFNQQKMVANNIHKISFANEPSQGIQNGNGVQNGNGAQNGNSENIFMSRGSRKRREETTPTSPSVNGGFSYKEINAKRERIIQEQMAKMQKESQMMMERYMDDGSIPPVCWGKAALPGTRVLAPGTRYLTPMSRDLGVGP